MAAIETATSTTTTTPVPKISVADARAVNRLASRASSGTMIGEPKRREVSSERRNYVETSLDDLSFQGSSSSADEAAAATDARQLAGKTIVLKS